MISKSTILLYEKVRLLRLGPGLSWTIFGILLFLTGYFFVPLGNLPDYWVIWAFYAMGIILWPNLIILIYRRFFKIFKDQEKMFWKNERDYLLWVKLQEKNIFGFNVSWAGLLAAIVSIAAPVSVLLSLLEYQGGEKNPLYWTAIGFIPTAFVGGHGMYILIALMTCLWKLSTHEVNIPFYRLPNPTISSLQNYYSMIVIIITFCYIHVALGLFLSPVGFPPVIIIWMAIGGFFPLGMFLVSVFFIHYIVVNIKQSHLNLINKEVQDILDKTIKNKSPIDYETLKQAMEVQEKVQNIREWPIEFSGTLTFIITLTTAITQLVVTIINST